MHALFVRTLTGAQPVPLVNAWLASTSDYGEAWLQRLPCDHPDLLPLDMIDPGAGGFIPGTASSPMPKPGGSVTAIARNAASRSFGGIGIAFMGGAVGVPGAAVLAVAGGFVGNRIGISKNRRALRRRPEA